MSYFPKSALTLSGTIATYALIVGIVEAVVG
ncbi:hypothetical protein R75461_07479 [Paraburkholderia nemoris]|nr:hypothetical protein R75461_07479 [Paraburkholderia nemoris]